MKTKRITFALFFVSVALSSGSCKTTAGSSRGKGHFENFSEAELLPYKGNVKVVPEFEESSGVIVTVEALDRFGLYPLLEALLQHPLKPKVTLPMLKTNYNRPPARLQAFLTNPQVALFPVEDQNQSIEREISWTRDWAPWTASFTRADSPVPEARLLDFNYYELRNLADDLPRIMSERSGIPRISIPIRTEGGNFMINNRGDCMMTTGVIDRESVIRNYKKFLDSYKSMRDESGRNSYDKIIARYELLVAGSKSYSKSDIERFFADYAGCKNTVWLPPSPADTNQHIDLFAKFLSDDIVLVMELSDATIATMPKSNKAEAQVDFSVSYAFVKQVQSHLNDVASTLASKGFRVVRAPLPLTMIYKIIDNGSELALPLVGRGSSLGEVVRNGGTPELGELAEAGLDIHMRSYANSLIVKPIAYVPRFRWPVIQDGYSSMTILGGDPSAVQVYPDAQLIQGYERQVVEAYATAGLSVVWIDSDQTVPYQGSIHCLTQQEGRVGP